MKALIADEDIKIAQEALISMIENNNQNSSMLTWDTIMDICINHNITMPTLWYLEHVNIAEKHLLNIFVIISCFNISTEQLIELQLHGNNLYEFYNM